MEFGKPDWTTFEQGIRKEWLLTNGIGGFASSTIICANARRYHGLLIAALKPPAGRRLILSKIDESLIIEGKRHDLFSYKTPDYTMEGCRHLQRVSINPLPLFRYSAEDVFIEKKIGMVYGENTVVVVYHIINGPRNARLRLAPLVNYRDYHFNSSRAHMRFDAARRGYWVLIRPYELDLEIGLYCKDAAFTELENCFFYNMDYPYERERGLYSVEDHYIPGYFEIEAGPGEDKYATIAATVASNGKGEGWVAGINGAKYADGLSILKKEEDRLNRLVKEAGYEDDFARTLVIASDNFIVHRESTGASTIVAGYPWFSDWGRDAMVALTGLTLCTRRFDDAKQVLHTFSGYIKYGLVPNLLPDEGGEPAYNSVDASLWFFESVNRYLEYTGDCDYVREKMYPVMENIIRHYTEGTIFNIKMDDDCLIGAGNEETQLTWMDAKAGGAPVTPRRGKAVEINALWYNALKIMSVFSARFGMKENLRYGDMAEKARESFTACFWNDESRCLYDVVSGEFKDGRVRPNQILALSLSYPVLTGERARKVVEKVWRELYTAYGLRSLSPFSDEYTGVYAGDQYVRDRAYHQGTVWAWLMGHFITAFLRAYGHTEENRRKALMFIEPFKDHLRDACVGSISEIFDGNEPHMPRGCFAQAWSVAEILRVYREQGAESREQRADYRE